MGAKEQLSQLKILYRRVADLRAEYEELAARLPSPDYSNTKVQTSRDSSSVEQAAIQRESLARAYDNAVVAYFEALDDMINKIHMLQNWRHIAVLFDRYVPDLKTGKTLTDKQIARKYDFSRTYVTKLVSKGTKELDKILQNGGNNS